MADPRVAQLEMMAKRHASTRGLTSSRQKSSRKPILRQGSAEKPRQTSALGSLRQESGLTGSRRKHSSGIDGAAGLIGSGLGGLGQAGDPSLRQGSGRGLPPLEAHDKGAGTQEKSGRRLTNTRGLGITQSKESLLLQKQSSTGGINQSKRQDEPILSPTQIKVQKLKNYINEKILGNPGISGTMTLLTIYALYGDDTRVYSSPPSGDIVFAWMSSIAFFCFIIELLLSCFAKPGYFQWNGFLKGEERSRKTFYKYLQIGSFYFYLDLIATVSLIVEIPWIYSTGSSEEDVNNTSTGNDNGLQSARAGRASRAGARAGRVVRVVRMVRLVRLVRLYRIIKDQLMGVKRGEDHHEELEEEELPPESRVGAMMSDLTTRRVIVGVLMMLICIPLLIFEETDASNTFGLNLVHDFSVAQVEAPNSSAAAQALNFSIAEFQARTPDLMELYLNGTLVFERDVGDRRDAEQKIVTITDTVEIVTVADGVFFNGTAPFRSRGVFDAKPAARTQALYGIMLTTFVIVLLAIGSMTFTKDVNTLVINPIEVMVDLVRKINADPIGFDYKVTQSFQEGLETTMLLQTIQKIGGLMRVGFGEAGASIIGKNLTEGAGQKLNLLTAGTKIQSIFGFCDVRNFTDTTECLQSEVMLFVNRIASVLHEIVAQCKGAANKNIGDAFLLTWKIEENWPFTKVASVADQALLSFALTVAEMTKSEAFVCQFSAQAMHRLYERMPGYKVKMGFGLHYGWAIEGAIGSERKIDASYISPHVNMSEFLESSTKGYGVGLLMSEAFYKLLSNAPKKYIRRVDRIKRTKSEDPMSLYTYDMVPERLALLLTQERRRGRKKSRRRSSLSAHVAAAATVLSSRRASWSKSKEGYAGPDATAHSAQAVAQAAAAHPGPVPGRAPGHSNGSANGGALEVTSVQSSDGAVGAAQVHKQFGDPLAQPGRTGHKVPGKRRGPHLRVAPEEAPPTPHAAAAAAAPNTGAGLPLLLSPKTAARQAFPSRGRAGSLSHSRGHGHRGSIITGRIEEGRVASTSLAHSEASSHAPPPTAPVIRLAPYTEAVWDEDPDLLGMRHHYQPNFVRAWEEAMDQYVAGDWRAAHDAFEALQVMLPIDGPIKLMLERTKSLRAPDDWEGYNDISEG